MIFTDQCSILLQNSQCLSSKCCLSLLRREHDYVDDHVWGINAGRNTKICFLCLMTGFLNHLTTFFCSVFFLCIEGTFLLHWNWLHKLSHDFFPRYSVLTAQSVQSDLLLKMLTFLFFFSKGHINNKWISNCFNSDHSKVTWSEL